MLAAIKEDSYEEDLKQLKDPKREFGVFEIRINPERLWLKTKEDTRLEVGFAITTLPGSDAHLEGMFPYRRLTPQPDLDFVSLCLQTCLVEHQKCRSNRLAEAPKRLIELGERGGDLCARLVETNGAHFEYVTLSHRWIDLDGIKTIKANYAARRDLLVLSDLSTTFQHAAAVTHYLKLRHLWIDALTIIQDDTSDWEEECPKMASIYQNAVVTLFAHSKESARFGLLPERAKFKYMDDDIELCYRDEAGVPRDRVVMVPRNRYFFDAAKVSSALRDRGWIAQEDILSKRKIHFGHDELSWSCHESVRDESNHESREVVSHQYMESILDSQVVSVGVLSAEWKKFVHSYSSRLFTQNLDRLPALSGIASYLSRRTSSRYIAGHWLETLPESLLWQPYTFYGKKGARLPPEAAPSWSWASWSGPCEFDEDPKMGGRNKNGAVALGEPNPRLKDKRVIAEVVDVDAVPLGQDPFGRLEKAKITIKGWTRSSEEPVKMDRSVNKYVTWDDDEHDNDTVVLICQNAAEHLTALTYRYSLSGLALQQVSGTSVFRRTGFAGLSSLDDAALEKFLFDPAAFGWMKRTITIV